MWDTVECVPTRFLSCISWLLLFFSAFIATAQTNPPPASYVRSYVNDLPDQPLVTVTVTGAVNVACFTIEETLPGPASALSVSSGGTWLPTLGAIRWGPFTNTIATNVSYRVTGMPASYPVNGGAWMDGQWYFSPATTMVPVLPSGGGNVPLPPPQLPAPLFVPPSGSAIPVDVLMGLPGWNFTLLDDTWISGMRTNQNLPQQSAWFASGSSANIGASANALSLSNGTSAVVGITYFTPNTTTPVALGVGDTFKATLKLVLTGVAGTNTAQGLRIGVFNFADSTLSPTRVSADGFSADGQGNGVQGYCLFQNMGTSLKTATPVDIRVRTNFVSATLQGITNDFKSLSGSVVSNNFPGFTAGRQYVLTLTLNRTGVNSLAFSASWLDTVTGGIFLNSATDAAATNFRFDGLAIRSQSAASTATNITLTECKIDYIPQATNAPASTTNAVIYFTLDGSLPTTSSTLYTGAVQLATASVVRARAFATGWAPSAGSVAYYGPLAAPAAAQVARSVNTNTPTAPMVTFNVVPGTNASCVAVTESLPLGLVATNVSAGGNYISSNNVVLWGPFFGTNVQSLSYQAVGQPGIYSVRSSWSVDGVSGGDGTNIVIASTSGSGVPTPPPQVAAPTFAPASGSNVPVNVTISCATPGATIYYTLNGSLPTASSLLYTGAVSLASASTVRAVGFTNGWTPSVASVAYYGPPAAPASAQVSRSVNTNSPTAPVVTFSVVPGASAGCVAVTESLPLGIGAANISAGGNYVASNNVVLWGPFFGTNAQTLSYQAVGQPGTYLTRAAWSVDGVSGGEAVGTNIVVASAPGSGFPTAPLQQPMPMLTPIISSNLPVAVSISSSDPQAQIYFTTDGSLPTQSSTPYTTPLNFSTRTTLLARSFRSGYLPSQLVVGEYSPLLTTNSLMLVRSIVGNGTFLPSIRVTATPSVGVNCYSVTESIAPGLTPSGLAADAVWNPADKTVRWEPYLDHQQRVLTYNLNGPSGTYPLAGQGSFDGYPATVTGATTVTVNAAYSGSPDSSITTCVTQPLIYNLNFNPAPGFLIVDSLLIRFVDKSVIRVRMSRSAAVREVPAAAGASVLRLVCDTAALRRLPTNRIGRVDSINGTLDWGDGTHVAVTQPVMTFQKQYVASGTYTITLSADWTGHTIDLLGSSHATKTDTVTAVTQCNPPVITAQPSNQMVFAGSTVQFSVTATSLYAMTFQWYFNRTNPFIGPIFSTLTLPNVAPQAAGLYSVLITNAFGSVTSSVVSLGVVTPLVTSITRNSNKSVTLNFIGLPNSATRIWVATNLAPPANWQAIYTNNNVGTNGTWQFTDTNASGFPARFYRFSTP